jgi:hypothetical protein
MSSKSHNKKRNVGIIYELLLRNISDSLIRDDRESASKALKIIETRFDKNTELYKEFRLFNALAKSTVSDSAVAAAILTEAKQAARRCNLRNLDREKSLLIKDINHRLSDPSFYHRRLPEYKTYATIQTLLNDWRAGDTSSLSRVIQYESKMVESLLSERKESSDIQDLKNNDVNSLVVKIMTEKLNTRYGDSLDREQKSILREYVFSKSKNSDVEIIEALTRVKKKCISDLERYKDTTSNSIILEKIQDVSKKLMLESIDNIDDNKISKFLVIMQLKRELGEALSE